MTERQNDTPFLAARLSEEWKEKIPVIATAIPDPILLADIPHPPDCSCCWRPMHKDYLNWEFVSEKEGFLKKRQLRLVVENTAGYQCSPDCDVEFPSDMGLLEATIQAMPIFEGRKFPATVRNLKWTKGVILEIIGTHAELGIGGWRYSP